MSTFKAVIWAASIGLVLWTASAWAEEGHEHGKQGHAQMQEEKAHIVGEVIDVVCYVRMDARGEKHIKCAEFCADKGSPLGILDEKSGQIYLVFPEGHGNPNEKVLSYIGKRVDVVGKVSTKGGLKGIAVETVSAAKK
ncbi:MAG: hypothetical protein O2954_13165 [bacterium]|nr:hypothetical protein [bacterium]